MAQAIVVMGVAGCGKSTIGAQLARSLSIPFIEGDSLHSRENVNWMAQGRPLTDDMRYPWLDEIAASLKGASDAGVVVSCSALKRHYRDRLRKGGDVFFLHIEVPRDVLAARMKNRQHFMPVSLLDSQLATLEPLEPDEGGIVIDGELPILAMIEQIKKQYTRYGQEFALL
jgi:carbohydrate kinase (thermoresistant glucokinase family)|tara:strand:+ start:507 stop:1019 length:513 start_codon:yes stop_codon:yes gene_type:complete